MESKVKTQGLQYHAITKEFQGKEIVTAVDDVSLSIPTGEITCLVGPSGCGKSTLLHMAAGLVTPTRGEITLDNNTVTGPGPERGVVFQQFALFPWKTVRENIEFGLKHQGVKAAEMRERAEDLMATMGLNQFTSHYPSQLSGGMQQRVAIARAYGPDPDLLLMDEPFGALDAQTRTIMQEDLMETWLERQKTVVFVTHAVDEAVYLGGKVVIMTKRPGKLKEVVDVSPIARTNDWYHRPIDEVTASKEFNEMKARIWASIREEIPSLR